MKTALSIPDDLFEEAERLARRLGKSRSRLYSDAVREYLARHSSDRVTRALDEVVEALDDRSPDFVVQAARETLERSEW